MLTKSEILERREMIINLRRNGYTLEEIGEVFNISKQRVDKILKSVTGRTNKECKALLRDDYKCQICFNNPNIKIHYLNGNKRDTRIENMMTLCVSCIKNIHDFIYDKYKR